MYSTCFFLDARTAAPQYNSGTQLDFMFQLLLLEFISSTTETQYNTHVPFFREAASQDRNDIGRYYICAVPPIS